MDKKFISAVIVCVFALTAIATGTYYLGQKSDENIVNLKEAGNTATTADDKNMEVAQNIIPMTEEVTERPTAVDRVGDVEEYPGSEPGETRVVGANTEVVEKETEKVVEENTESNVKGKDYLYGLSSEAAAQIRALKFGKDSQILWPVEGNIIIPYDMENTVYFSTLNEYRCSPGLVIQSSKGAAIKAASDGVITKIEEDGELGVCIYEAIGNDYIATYGQITNPEVAAGDYVEAGQTIAYVSKPTRYYSVEGDNLYFAITKSGKTVDPLSFIAYED